MSYLRRFARFWWEFIVGDNLALALGAGATIGVTALLVDKGVNAWWLLPTGILALLAISVIRAADPSNPLDTLLRRRKSDAMESQPADTRMARLAGEASVRDVEQLGD